MGKPPTKRRENPVNVPLNQSDSWVNGKKSLA
jgi:hypothetical protein